MAYMRIWPCTRAALTSTWLVLVPAALPAEEALLKDGKRIAGSVATSANGRLLFTAKASNDSLSWETIQQIEFPLVSRFNDPLVGLRRVSLVHDQSITGELLGWSKEGLRFRLSGMEARTLPPSFVRAVRHTDGYVALLEEDFANGLTEWKLEGKPELVDADRPSGKQSLNLRSAGQSATYRLAEPLKSGLVGVDFALGDSSAKGRTAIVLEFQRESGPRSLEVSVIRGEGGNQVQVAPPEGEHASRACKPGRHRVLVDWKTENATVYLDDEVLCVIGAPAVGGALSVVRLACIEAEEKSPAPLVIEGVLITGTRTDKLDVPPTTDQDMILLPSGDQLFGRIVSANRRAIELESRGRQRKLAWREVVGFCPRVDTIPPRTLEGEWTRVWLRTGMGGWPDELEVVVTKMDENRLSLRHPALGDLTTDRSRLVRLRRLFYGQRIELDNDPHHLGDKDRVVPGLQPRHAEGVSLTKKFRLEAVPATTRFIVSVVQLKGPGDGIELALERGELRTEVWINGERVDYLNRLVDKAQTRPQRLTVTIPKKFLRAGENVLELRQIPEAGTDHYENCGVSELLIETER
jgi:hypothetical protein